MNRRFILIYRIILFTLAFLGVYLEITKYGVGMLMYYTVLSNLLVLLFTGYLVYLMTRPSDAWKAPKILRIKGGVTMSIMITCVVYHLLLAPIATDFYRLENFLCHYISLTNRASTVGLIRFLGQVYLWSTWPLLFLMAFS